MASEFGTQDRFRESRKVPVGKPASKPPFTVETRRDEYVIVGITIRSRRDWRTVPPQERFALLLDMADVLDEYAGQMRTEAEEIEQIVEELA